MLSRGFAGQAAKVGLASQMNLTCRRTFDTGGKLKAAGEAMGM
jgi:hypothetical protein